MNVRLLFFLSTAQFTIYDLLESEYENGFDDMKRDKSITVTNNEMKKKWIYKSRKMVKLAACISKHHPSSSLITLINCLQFSNTINERKYFF